MGGTPQRTSCAVSAPRTTYTHVSITLSTFENIANMTTVMSTICGLSRLYEYWQYWLLGRPIYLYIPWVGYSASTHCSLHGHRTETISALGSFNRDHNSPGPFNRDHNSPGPFNRDHNSQGPVGFICLIWTRSPHDLAIARLNITAGPLR